MNLEAVEQRLGFVSVRSLALLVAIFLVSIFLRLYYYPHNIPIALDGQAFFWYANDMAILGKFPTGYGFPNNTWPAFLSLFFSMHHSTNFMDYMTIQRVVSMLFSVITIIPVYLLCKKFVDSPYALMGAAVFAFEPRIIQNSLLGLTDPLFIFLIAMTGLLFASESKKSVYASFMVAGLASIVRPEGVFMFFAISSMFFVRGRRESRVILRYLVALSIFILTILPMTIIRIDMGAGDPITGRLSSESGYILSSPENDPNSNLLLYFINGIENPIKLVGWTMIPIFVILLPVGFFWLFKKTDYKKLLLICIIGLLLVPAVYSMTRGSDTRYLLPLYPFFCVLSAMTVQIFGSRIKKNNLFLILVIVGVLLTSVVFLDFRKVDLDHEREALEIGRHVNDKTTVINEYYPESLYVNIPDFERAFPILHENFKETVRVEIVKEKSLSEFINTAEEKGITHLVVDDNENRPEFFKLILENEENYRFLTKEFDSHDYGFSYHVKIFRINYLLFEGMERN